MRRRDFVTVLCGATVRVAAARTPEPRHVVGSLSGFSNSLPDGLEAAFYQALKEAGFSEGRI